MLGLLFVLCIIAVVLACAAAGYAILGAAIFFLFNFIAGYAGIALITYKTAVILGVALSVVVGLFKRDRIVQVIGEK